MKRVGKVLGWGAAISFLGSLPLGILNVTVTQLSVEKGIEAAFAFAFAAMLVELVYVFITLRAMSWVSRRIRLFRVFEWLTALLILVLSVNSLAAAINSEGISSLIPARAGDAVMSGIILSALNPLHVIFWFGWSTILMEKGILRANKAEYNFYTFGIGIGTMLGFAVFIYGGNYIINRLMFNQALVNWVIGIVLLCTAVIQVYKIRKKPLATAPATEAATPPL